jgi:hypothetical protein
MNAGAPDRKVLKILLSITVPFACAAALFVGVFAGRPVAPRWRC